jgi:type II secretory pathway pseudopilin PulG
MFRTRQFKASAYAILERMKGGRKAHGFTIIETLVVLGVSTALFVAVVATMQGRQGRTQFSQSIQDVKSQIQQVMNDVGSGFYPDTNNFTCTANASGPSISAGTSKQGANTGCIFLGKAIQFQVNNTTGNEQLQIYTVAGLQKDTTTGKEVDTYAAAKPVVIAPSTSNPTMPDASTKGIVKYGLKLNKMYYGASNTNIGAVGFLTSLASYSTGGGNPDSVSQNVNVIPINNTTLGGDSTANAQAINNNIASSPTNDPTGISLCFVSGTSNQLGIITIGGKGRQLSLTVDIRETKTCP